MLADVASRWIENAISASGASGLTPHGHGVDADHRISAGGDQTTQRELANDTQTQNGGGATERQPGADRRTQAIARDARHGRLLHVQIIRQTPQSAALVTDRQQFGGGMIAGIADTVAGLPAGHR